MPPYAVTMQALPSSATMLSTIASSSTKPRRCCAEGCKTRLTLTDFACKCQKTFCWAHRPCEAHACSFDFRGAAREELLKTMSTPIVAAKVEAI